MVAVAITGALYFITITILQQDTQNLTHIVSRIAENLDENSTNITVLHTFKVTGERQVIAVVRASSNTALDNILNRLYSVGSLVIDSKPVITYESFGRNLGVSDELTQPSTVVFKQDDNLYWLAFRVDYFGNKTSELLPIWKTVVEGYLTAIKSGAFRAIFYKNLGEREVQLLLHVPDREQLDLQVLHCPMIISFGSNIRVVSKGVNFIGQ